MQRELDRPLAEAEESPPIVAWRARQVLPVVLAAGVALVGLSLVASRAGSNSVDLGATLWLQSFQQPAFAALMAAVSWPGFFPQNWIVPVLLAVALASLRLWPEALWLLGTQASTLATQVVKNVVHRQRPSPELVRVAAPLTDPSFPSGHVVQYTVILGFLFFLAYVLMRRSARRTATLVLLAVPIVLVGPSRLYLGQHWLSDALGGYAIAALLLVPYCWAYTTWRLSRTRQRVGPTRRHARGHRSWRT